MKKVFYFLFALVVSMTASAQTSLTSGRTVVPLGGLKTYSNGTAEYTISNDDLQKITVDGNTANVYLFPEGGYNTDANKAVGIQGFYIDLGASKAIGAIKSTWEGADAGGNIYVTDTEPAADGTLTGETLIATFTNAQEAAKDVAVAADNSGRYIVFVPTEATNYDWGVKIRTFVALEKEASVLTSLEVRPSVVKVGEETPLTLRPLDQVGLVINEGVSYTVSSGTLNGSLFTADAEGDITVTARYQGVEKTATIKAVSVSAPTANPTEPADLAANVIAVYSAKYDKGLVDNNPAWGVDGGAPNPFYNTLEEVEIADGHKVVHVQGTGFNNRTAGGVGITNDYTKIHVAVYPYTSTEAKIFGDNAYGSAITVTGLVPGQWNYVEVDNSVNFPNYVLIELVGESEFYLDHFYFAKQAIDDEEAPVLNTAEVASEGIGSVTLRLKATDDKSEQVTYVITDQDGNAYTTKGANGAEITYAIGGLEYEKNYIFSVVAKDNNENASAPQTVSATTRALIAAPVPDKDADKVKSLYSNQYTPAVAYHYGEWGQFTVVAPETVGGDEMLKLTSYNYLGFEFEGATIDLADMEYVHIDVLPSQAMTLHITPIMNGGTPTELPTSVGTLTVGEWNACDVKLADLGLDYDNYQSFQLKIDGGSGTDVVYVDNIYFWTSESPEPVVNPVPVPDEPTTAAEKVLAVFSDTYGKDELTTSSPAWGGYKDATGDDLYTSFDYKVLTAEDGSRHKVVHVTGTGINSRTKDDTPATGFNKLHAAIYPTTATSAVIFKDNAYADRVTVTGLVPDQWNYVETTVDFDNNYVTIALDGETEFYVDHIYFEKDSTTAISTVQSSIQATHYHNLHGQRLSGPASRKAVVKRHSSNGVTHVIIL